MKGLLPSLPADHAVRRLTPLLAVAVYPIVLLSALFIMTRNLASLTQNQLAARGGAILLGVALVVLALERIMPYREDWNLDHDDTRTDVLHIVISYYGVIQLLKALFAAISVSLLGWSSRFWPAGWPIAAQVSLALLVGEFFLYWAHRWLHERPALWRLHEPHHSSKRLYWLNSARFHPLDIAFQTTLGTIPLLLLGLPGPILETYLVLTATHGLMQHSNLAVKLGPFNRLLSMAEVHRWHHSIEPRESGHNYGKVLLIYDLVFGTYYFPREREVGPLGISEPGYPTGYWAQLARVRRT